MDASDLLNSTDYLEQIRKLQTESNLSAEKQEIHGSLLKQSIMHTLLTDRRIWNTHHLKATEA